MQIMHQIEICLYNNKLIRLDSYLSNEESAAATVTLQYRNADDPS